MALFAIRQIALHPFYTCMTSLYYYCVKDGGSSDDL